MAKVITKSKEHSEKSKTRPALTAEVREMQLIAKAYDLAEQRLTDGTASAQEVTHFLKLGSSKEKLEREKLEAENRLLVAKVESLQSQQRTEEMYIEALAAMRNYAGYGDEEKEEEYDD